MLNAHSWWIASELVRRHPHLFLVEHHPVDGFYDSLGIVDLHANKGQVLVDINRPGSVHVHSAPDFDPLSLVESMGAHSAHDSIKRIEEAARWTAQASPKTTARSLTYSVIARVLAAMVIDRHVWDVRSEMNDSILDDDPANGHLKEFPLGQFLSMTLPSIGVLGEPWVHVWALTKDGKPVAILDTAGRVVTVSGLRELLPLYRHHNCSLTRVIADALGDVLP
jgi:hypothetical protein